MNHTVISPSWMVSSEFKEQGATRGYHYEMTSKTFRGEVKVTGSYG